MSEIVEAAAGTGKTESLITKILDWVYGERRLNLSRILALTFTEKAANEMRQRLSDTLSELVRGSEKALDLLARRLGRRVEPDEARVRAREGLAEIEGAQITTIHSFCAHILRLFPIEAGVAPGFQVDEGERFEAFFDRRWREWLDRQLGEGGAGRGEWEELLSAVSLADLRELAAELCRKVSVSLPVESKLPARSEVEPVHALGRTLLEQLGSQSNDQVRSVKLSVRLMKEYLEGRLRASDLSRARLIEDKAPGQKKYESIRDDVLRVCRMGRHLPGAIAVAAASRLLAPFVRDFRDELVQKGTLTFEALLSFARRVLHSNLFVRHQLKQMFAAILVDEFQDTDPIQYDIILFLAERPESFANDVRRIELEPHKLYIVGDPKQSIYAFRGADIEAYEEIKQVVLRNGGTPRRLDVNYRSRAEILEVVNTIFSKLMVFEKGLQPDYIAFKPHRTEPSPDPDSVQVVRMAGKKLSADAARGAEARYIAEWIDEHIAAGERGKVAILLRSLNDVQMYLDRLRRKGIPYVIEGEKFFYQAQEIIDVTNLLQAVVNPHDEIAIVGFLRSFAAGLSDPEVFALRGRLHYLAHQPADPYARRIYAAMRDLHERSSRIRVDELVDLALERFPFLPSAAATYYGPQAVSNLLKIRMQAAEAARSGNISAAAFVDQVRRNIESLKEEGESPIADERLDAVKVLSIHRSKGLEFDTVFLPDMHRKLEDGVDDRVLTEWSTGQTGLALGKAAVDSVGLRLRLKVAARKREESLRVLYVAMTRAKSKLILTGRIEPGGASFAAKLCLALPSLAGSPPGLWPAGGGHIRVIDYAPPGPWKFRLRSEKARARVDAAKLSEAWKNRCALYDSTLAATVVSTPAGQREKGIAIDEEVDESPIREKREAAIWIGIVCHDLLARLDWSQPRLALDAALAEVPPEHRDVVRTKSESMLNAFISSEAFRRIAAARILGREVPFVLSRGSQLVSGRIDLLLQEDKTWWIVDYKTGGGEDLIDSYGPQLAAYKEALSQAAGDRPLRTAILHLPTSRWIEKEV